MSTKNVNQDTATRPQEAPGQAKGLCNDPIIQDEIKASYTEWYTAKFLTDLAISTQALGCDLIQRGDVRKGVELIDTGMVLFMDATDYAAGKPMDVNYKSRMFDWVQEVLPVLYAHKRLNFEEGDWMRNFPE